MYLVRKKIDHFQCSIFSKVFGAFGARVQNFRLTVLSIEPFSRTPAPPPPPNGGTPLTPPPRVEHPLSPVVIELWCVVSGMGLGVCGVCIVCDLQRACGGRGTGKGRGGGTGPTCRKHSGAMNSMVPMGVVSCDPPAPLRLPTIPKSPTCNETHRVRNGTGMVARSGCVGQRDTVRDEIKLGEIKQSGVQMKETFFLQLNL